MCLHEPFPSWFRRLSHYALHSSTDIIEMIGLVPDLHVIYDTHWIKSFRTQICFLKKKWMYFEKEVYEHGRFLHIEYTVDMRLLQVDTDSIIFIYLIHG